MLAKQDGGEAGGSVCVGSSAARAPHSADMSAAAPARATPVEFKRYPRLNSDWRPRPPRLQIPAASTISAANLRDLAADDMRRMNPPFRDIPARGARC